MIFLMKQVKMENSSQKVNAFCTKINQSSDAGFDFITDVNVDQVSAISKSILFMKKNYA